MHVRGKDLWKLGQSLSSASLEGNVNICMRFVFAHIVMVCKIKKQLHINVPRSFPSLRVGSGSCDILYSNHSLEELDMPVVETVIDELH